MNASVNTGLATDGLNLWKVRYSEAHREQFPSMYLFSPEWIDLYQTLWTDYDNLNAIRKNAGKPILQWQAAYEKERDAHEEMRAFCYQPMHLYSALRYLLPLSIHMDEYLQQRNQDFIHPWKSVSVNWTRFQELYRSDQSSFRDSLSETQHFSFNILDEWWSALYCNPKLIAATKEFIQKNHERRDTCHFPNEKRGDLLATTSLYHSFCLELFLKEFHPHDWSPYTCLVKLQGLQGTRYHTACHALTQRLSYAVLLPENGHNLPQNYPRALANQDIWLNHIETGCGPLYLWDVAHRRTIQVCHLVTPPEYTCVSHTWGRWRKEGPGKEIEGVPWKVPENTLYDVGQMPDWLERLDTPFVWLDLFCIPQDGRPEADIEIGRQAAIFRRSKTCVAWLHDCTGWQGVEKALDWLALSYYRLTNRFNNVETIDSRREIALQQATQLPAELVKLYRICLQNFERERGLFVYEQDGSLGEPCSWFSSLWTLQEATLCPQIRLYSRNWEPLLDRRGFCITLATLMIFLRESATAVNACIEPTEALSDPHKYKTTIQNVSQSKTVETRYTGWPASAVSLEYLAQMTRLDSVLSTLEPLEIFINANIRICTADRAPAIMSAIGVTDWFSKSIQQRQAQIPRHQKYSWSLTTLRKQPLVLDCFPLAFLRECVRKFGASFYEVQITQERLSVIKTFAMSRPVGSLLPFTKPERWFTKSIGQHVTIRLLSNDHESVRCWEIQESGTVKISTAGIASSSHRVTDTSKTMRIVVYLHGVCYSKSDPTAQTRENFAKAKSFEINTWNDAFQTLLRYQVNAVGEAPKQYRWYAVCLYQESFHQHGVLLMSPEIRSEPKWPRRGRSRRPLIKIGTYFTHEYTMPPSTAVNWVVL